MERKLAGCWIAFEGNDGAGKTTQLDMLEEYLKDRYLPVVRTREPGGNEISELIRREVIFNEKLKNDGKAQLLAFTLARRINIHETVLPALIKGQMVLSDRSEGSTRAYQQYQMGVDEKEVDFINGFATDGISPDLTILLHVSRDVGMERVKQAKGLDMTYFDKEAAKGWDLRDYGYLQMAQKMPNWRVVNADNCTAQVYNDVILTIQESGVTPLL